MPLCAQLTLSTECTVRAVRVSKTKITLENGFIVNLFPLGGKKNQNITKGPSYGAPGEF